MLFSSILFIFRFLPVFMLLYYLVPNRYRNTILFVGSLIFYGAGEPRFVYVMLFSIGLNYTFYLAIYRCRNERMTKAAYPALLVANFLLLFVFKYWDFTAKTWDAVSGSSAMPLLHLALPLGISFYTFQVVSLQIDSYRKKRRGEPGKEISLLNFATYIMMFPQLVAGPILKYEEVEKEMEQRRCSAENMERGFRFFVFGLALKVLLANQIGTLWTTICSAGMDSLSVPVAWMGAFAYSFQIYFDFWGYSLMAIGLGEMMGFYFPENFNHPYQAKSMSEFWRRWHITLGRWFREYVYIPMGGSRCSFPKVIRNIMIVWALTGLWHGASWNFVIWGLTFFVLISLEKIFYGKKLEKSKIIGHIYMILLIPITWVIFAVNNLSDLIAYLRCMFGIPTGTVLTGMEQFMRYLRQYGVLTVFCILFSTAFPMWLFRRYEKKCVMVPVLFAVFAFSVYEIACGSSNPFLYFRF